MCTKFNHWEVAEKVEKKKKKSYKAWEENLLLKFYVHGLHNSYNPAIICAGNSEFWWWQYVLVTW